MEKTPPEWWGDDEAVKRQRGYFMTETAKLLESRSEESDRQDMNLVHARMFENAPLPTLYHFGGPASRDAGYSMYGAAKRTAWNVLRAAADHARAQVCRSRPRPRFLTTDGTFKQKRRAKKLTQFNDGLFQEAKTYTLTKQVFRDGEVFDAGGIQVLIEDDRVRHERVLSCECTVDQSEAANGRPRTLYRRRYMDRGVVLARWGGKEGSERWNAIKAVNAVDPYGTGAPSNVICVREAWHLASKKGADDGWHVIAVEGADDGATLFTEKWPKDYFPIVWFVWSTSLSGYWGRSFTELAAPTQYEIDKMLVRAERADRFVTTPRIAWPRGANVAPSKLNNAEGSILEYSGNNPPTLLAWDGVAPQYWQRLQDHVAKIYDLAGISQQAAQGQKEAGVVSAVAIRESQDVAQTNLAPIQQDWDQFHVDIARISIDLARDLYAKKGEYEVAAPVGKRGFMETVDWKDVGLPEDDYVIEIYPSNLLPTQPAGRLETVQDMVKSGLWSPERGAAALDDLDVDSNESIEQAAERLLQSQFEGMLYDGKPAHPDEFTDFDRAMKLGAQYVVLGELEGAPEKHIDLCRRYLDEVKFLAGTLAPPPAPAPMGIPGQPAQQMPGMLPAANPDAITAVPAAGPAPIGLAPPPGTLSPMVPVA